MVILLGLILLFSAVAPAHGATGVTQVLDKVGLAFEQNQGQFVKVKFQVRAQGYGLI